MALNTPPGPGMAPPMAKPSMPGAGSTMPAAVPTNNLGTQARVRQGIIALSRAMLELVKMAGPESEEGQVLLAALKSTSKIAADANPDLQAKEMQLLMEKAKGPQGPPQAGDIKQKLMAFGLGAPGGPGAPGAGAPGGAPSPMQPPAPATAGAM